MSTRKICMVSTAESAVLRISPLLHPPRIPDLYRLLHWNTDLPAYILTHQLGALTTAGAKIAIKLRPTRLVLPDAAITTWVLRFFPRL